MKQRQAFNNAYQNQTNNQFYSEHKVYTMLVGIILLGIVIAFFVYLVAIYNRLVRLKNQVGNGLSQIDVQLKRRHDLIPNLVETAQKYLGHEAQTLIMVTQARNQACATQSTPHSADDGENLALLAKAETLLSQALGQFYAVVENYPELKADSLMKQVMDELTNTENRIGFARQHYNDSVMFYNNHREVFPNNLVSGFFKFDRLYELQFADKAQIDIASKVHFN